MAKFRLDAAAAVPPTPFYYYDLGLLRQTLSAACTEAKRYGYHLHYALKANVEPRVLEEIRRAGFGADCVSGGEVRRAIESGFAASGVVFAGVGKSDEEIRYAVRQGIFAFNCESLQELEVIDQLAQQEGCTARIALRINPNVQPDTHAYISTGQAESKFGISYAEIEAALAELDKLQHLQIVGVHFHIGSQILNLESFRKLALRANQVQAWLAQRGVRIQVLNLGGGLGIDYQLPDEHPMPDFAGYFRVFHQTLEVGPGVEVHFELGRSIVGQCGELITRVLYTKQTASGAHWAITDAGMTELIRPALYDAYHQIDNLSALVQGRAMATEKYYIGGPICESSDVFARELAFPRCERGDILSIRSTGAYGSIMASHYNLRPTAPSYFSEE